MKTEEKQKIIQTNVVTETVVLASQKRWTIVPDHLDPGFFTARFAHHHDRSRRPFAPLMADPTIKSSSETAIKPMEALHTDVKLTNSELKLTEKSPTTSIHFGTGAFVAVARMVNPILLAPFDNRVITRSLPKNNVPAKAPSHLLGVARACNGVFSSIFSYSIAASTKPLLNDILGDHSEIARFASGCVVSVAETLVSQPVAVAINRSVATGTPVLQILRETPPSQLFASRFLATNLLRDIVFTAPWLFTVPLGAKALEELFPEENISIGKKGIYEMASGAAAAVFVCSPLSTPIQTILVRMTTAKEPLTFMNAAKQIFKNEGAKAFMRPWPAIATSLGLRSAITAGFMFFGNTLLQKGSY